MTRKGNKRHDARRDDSEPAIKEALEAIGWHVWRDLPVDLLCWHPVHGYRVLECKSYGEPLKPRKGRQENFVLLTGCPIVDTPEAAIEALNA